ncbi:NUDIX domain-containing protein [Candidatus Parcubacteria bacterium]|nr:NUDIX domain-containing protein [Candidatus Parcubacteria bacterium]
MKTQIQNQNKKVGVVVGRFQTPYLHDGHLFTLNKAAENRNLFVVVGVAQTIADDANPLDFKTREIMLKQAYPNAVIRPIFDHSSDVAWSMQLDNLIAEHFPEHEVIMFGSRDSFLPHYHGAHKKEEIESPIRHLSATALRNDIVREVIDSPEFRAGAIYTSYGIYPTSFQTVDMVIQHSTRPQVIVGRKHGEDKWRFPGGFVDPKDQTLELAAKREVKEEVGNIEIDDIKYVASARVEDHRYRKSKHKVMTTLFVGTYIFGPLTAGDDLEEVRWQDLGTLTYSLIEGHKPLAELYLKTRNK